MNPTLSDANAKCQTRSSHTAVYPPLSWLDEANKRVLAILEHSGVGALARNPRDLLPHDGGSWMRSNSTKECSMHLVSHRLTVEEDGVPQAALVFIIENLARERMDLLARRYKQMGFEVEPNSSPNYIKLTKEENLVTLHLKTQPFDDGKRFYAPNLTVFDNT